MESTAATKRHGIARSGTRRWERGQPVFVIAEIGINHNGSLELAKQLIDGALPGRRRRGEVPEAHARAVRAARPVGPRARHALGPHDLHRLPPQGGVRRRASTPPSTGTAASAGMLWFASCWDEESVDFMERFDPPCYKVASASLTDHALLRKMKSHRPAAHPLDRHVDDGGDRRRRSRPSGRDNLLIAHATSTYPCPVERPEPAHDRHAASALYPGVPDRLLRARDRPRPDLGGGHPRRDASSSATSPSTARCGAATRRRRSRSAASCAWSRNIRDIEQALGDGVKRVYDRRAAADRRSCAAW